MGQEITRGGTDASSGELGCQPTCALIGHLMARSQGAQAWWGLIKKKKKQEKSACARSHRGPPPRCDMGRQGVGTGGRVPVGKASLPPLV